MSGGLPFGLADLQREAAAGRSLPPVERWNPAQCGDIDIRKELVRLFSTILRRDGDDYVLVTPVEKMRIKVEDAPFMAVLMDAEGQGRDQRLIFTTNVGDVTVAGADNPIRVETDPETEQPAPYVHVRRGLEARIARAVFYQLADLAFPGDEEHKGMLGVWSGGAFFPIGRHA
jgi:hypothetical protein